ncbi:MAG: ABC transporter permease [Oscillospiraceae bacterium]|jgi:ABC-2 type transport system permease protein|nr:ABC transporter permease [Oscillospiraceae bacterium]
MTMGRTTMGKILWNLRFTAKMIHMLVKMKLTRMMAFRLSFFGGFFADGAFFVTQVLAFQAIYGHADEIGGWGRGQTLIFVGTFSMLNGINMLVYFFGVIRIPRLIREGGLDVYITKPGSALLRLTFESVDPGCAPLLPLSAGIIAYGARVAGIHVTPGLAAGYVALTLLMALLYYDMEVILRTLPFFFIGASAVERIEGEALTLNFRIPGVFYKGAFKVIFMFILPYGVMATTPARMLTRTLEPSGLIHALAVVVVFTWFALWFWRFGLRHYKSAGG